MFATIRAWSPKKKILFYTILDIVFSWLIPSIAIAIAYDLFAVLPTPTQTRATAWTYLIIISLVAAIVWRVREIGKLTQSHAVSYAIKNAGVPAAFLVMFLVLYNAKDSIERLQAVLLVTALSQTIAIFWRYKVGQNTKLLLKEDIRDTLNG